MAQSTLYIHIGTPKTGTTALQGFLAKNRKTLQEHGAVFPDFGLVYKGVAKNRNAHFLVATKDPFRAKEMGVCMKILKQQAALYPKILISDESIWTFYGHPDVETAPFWKKLKEMLDGMDLDLKVIVYLRRQDQYAFSYYAQKIKEIEGTWATLELKTTAGSAASLRLLQKGFLEAAIVQSDVLDSADKGTGVFIKDAIGDKRTYSAACGLYTEAVQIVVRKDSDIKNVDDLTGKVVSVGEEQSGVIQNAEQILQVFGISFSDIQVKHLSFEDSANALRKKEIDAFFCTAGAPTPAVAELFRYSEVRLLSLQGEDIKRIRKHYPGYTSCTIQAGTYEKQEEDVYTVGVRAVLVVANHLDKVTVKKLTETIYTNAGSLNRDIAGEGDMTAEKAVESIVIPFHSGASTYLLSQGAKVEVDKNGEKSDDAYGSQDE